MTKSCGCLGREIQLKRSEAKTKDECGKRYGRLVVLGKSKSLIYSGFMGLCMRCGTKVTVYGASLRNGNTTTCGCSHRQLGEKNRLWKFEVLKRLGQNGISGLDPRSFFSESIRPR